MIGKAIFSPNKKYRYALARIWNKDEPGVLFIGLNPSTADEKYTDGTVTRCINFTKDWNFGFIWMVNLFGFRTVDPVLMMQQENPIGFGNDSTIKRIANKCELIIAAWGTMGSFMNRDEEIIELLKDRELYCLGKNKNGSPKHPLYLKREVKIELWK